MKRIIMVLLAMVLAASVVGCGTSTGTNQGAKTNANTGANTNTYTPEQTTTHTHSYGNWETIKEPTCESQGEMIRRCSCGATESGYKDALGHEYGSDSQVCWRCGKLNPDSPVAKCSLTVNGLPATFYDSSHRSHYRIDAVLNYEFSNGGNTVGLTVKIQGTLIDGNGHWVKAKLTNGTYSYTDYGSLTGDPGDTSTCNINFKEIQPGNYTLTFVDFD